MATPRLYLRARRAGAPGGVAMTRMPPGPEAGTCNSAAFGSISALAPPLLDTSRLQMDQMAKGSEGERMKLGMILPAFKD